jgi:hypothetical protein
VNKELTIYTLGYNLPVYNPWLYSTEKFKEKNAT